MSKSVAAITAEFEAKIAAAKESETKIAEALNALKGMNADVQAFLLENKDEIKDASTIGKVTRIKDSERNKLAEQLDLAIAAVADQSKIALVIEGREMLIAGYKLPTTKRLNEDEKSVAFKNTLTALSDGDTDLATWVWSNLDDILSAYKAATPPPPKAGQVALLAHRMNVAGDKAAEAGQTEVAAAYHKARDLALVAKESKDDSDAEAAFAAESVAKELKAKAEA